MSEHNPFSWSTPLSRAKALIEEILGVHAELTLRVRDAESAAVALVKESERLRAQRKEIDQLVERLAVALSHSMTVLLYDRKSIPAIQGAERQADAALADYHAHQKAQKDE